MIALLDEDRIYPCSLMDHMSQIPITTSVAILAGITRL